MPALAPAHPTLRALALDVEAALASLSQRFDLLEARSHGGSDSPASPRLTHLHHRRPHDAYGPDTPPLSAPLRDDGLDEEQRHLHHQRRMAEVLTPGSSVEGADAGARRGAEDGEGEEGDGGEDKCMPIAIVGMGCRFPQEATSPEKLWEMLYEKRHARTEVPGDRFNGEGFYHPDGDRSGSVSLFLLLHFYIKTL